MIPPNHPHDRNHYDIRFRRLPKHAIPRTLAERVWFLVGMLLAFGLAGLTTYYESRRQFAHEQAAFRESVKTLNAVVFISGFNHGVRCGVLAQAIHPDEDDPEVITNSAQQLFILSQELTKEDRP